MTDVAPTTDDAVTQTLIIGAGLAGLCCGTALARSGRPVRIIEATDRPGGRVRSDSVDGFTLDHGFQVLLTAYPACREWLDYDALQLCAFEPGADVRQSGAFRVLGDPWRRPLQAIATATNPVGSLSDKLRIARLRRDAGRGDLESLYTRPSTSTIRRLTDEGFSDRFIDQFFRPFLGGVFLDESLQTSSRMLEFVFRMFAAGDIAVPAGGMAQIPRQLADRLPDRVLQLGDAVIDITHDGVHYLTHLSSGVTMRSTHLVIATEADAAARWLGRPASQTQWSGTTNLYYDAPASPNPGKRLMLRGDERGPIQTATVISDVAPSYAPPGRSLVSVSVDGSDFDPHSGDADELDRRVRGQLQTWFGDGVLRWRTLRIYRVPYALPRLTLDDVLHRLDVDALKDRPVPAGTLYVCGDHQETASIQGAMNTGLRVAEALNASFAKSD